MIEQALSKTSTGPGTSVAFGPIKTVLLDYDGCTADTEPQALRKLTDVLNRMLVSKNCNDLLEYEYVVKNLTGRTCRDILIEVATKRNLTLTEPEIEKWVAEEREENIKGFKENVTPSPGVKEALPELKTVMGLEVAIVSSSHGQRIEACMDTLGQGEFIEKSHIFSAQSSLDKPKPKPDPAIYLHALEKLGREATECIAVEDSSTGARAARRAGILLVGFVGTEPVSRHHERAEMLFECGARWVIKDMTKLPIIVNKIGSGEISALDREFGPEAWVN